MDIVQPKNVKENSLEQNKEIPHIHIESSRGWIPIKGKDLWDYRELLYFLIWRDIKVRYKQTFLGAMWAIIQPFFTMVVFSLFFGTLAKIPSDNIPYPIFSYAALVPWTFFANGLTQATSSMVGNANLIKKVYFPRLVIPISSVLSGIVDFALSFIVLVGMMLFYKIVPTKAVLMLPVFLSISIITSLGVGFWLSALNVKYRDFRFIVPFIIQFWMFASPIAYSSKMLNEPWLTVYGLNPMVGVLDGFRWALLGTRQPSIDMMLVSTFVSIAIFVSGLYYFRRMEKNFADLV